MMTVEREIGSIESANINKETLDAMKNASKAIQNIHGGLTVDQVDQTMEDLREQHAVGEEIAEALTQGAQTSGVDEDELDEELAELQQEALDERMLKTGSVPVHDQIQRMPNAPSKFIGSEEGEKEERNANSSHSKEHSHGGRRRRGGRTTEAAGRDGHVRWRGGLRCSARVILSICESLRDGVLHTCLGVLPWNFYIL
jgi:charged multivesicular body protein 4